MLNYPKIKARFPNAYKHLEFLSKETGITEINRLIFEYMRRSGRDNSFSLISDLKVIESEQDNIENP